MIGKGKVLIDLGFSSTMLGDSLILSLTPTKANPTINLLEAPKSSKFSTNSLTKKSSKLSTKCLTKKRAKPEVFA